jgi:hypothetical protein
MGKRESDMDKDLLLSCIRHLGWFAVLPFFGLLKLNQVYFYLNQAYLFNSLFPPLVGFSMIIFLFSFFFYKQLRRDIKTLKEVS